MTPIEFARNTTVGVQAKVRVFAPDGVNIVNFEERCDIMSLVHSYDLTSGKGREDALGDALEALAEAVKSIAGSQGAMVLRDRKEANRFLFLEFWDSEDSRKAAGSQLPKEVMGQIMGSVAGPLRMADFDLLAG